METKVSSESSRLKSNPYPPRGDLNQSNIWTNLSDMASKLDEIIKVSNSVVKLDLDHLNMIKVSFEILRK